MYIRYRKCAWYTLLKIIIIIIIRYQVPPWYSPTRPKPVYENSDAQVYWDVPVFAKHNEVRSSLVDARIVNHKSQSIITLEMSCP